MRIYLIATSFALLGRASAFSFSPSAFGVSKTCLQMTESGEATVEVAPPKSGLTMKSVHRMMKNASAETFDDIVKTIEPFLIDEAGTTMLKKTTSRLTAKAKLFGKTLPDGYATGAAATSKRSAKQDAFIATKEEARIAAEAQAIADSEAAAAAAGT
jgi:hypothetical protein